MTIKDFDQLVESPEVKEGLAKIIDRLAVAGARQMIKRSKMSENEGLKHEIKLLEAELALYKKKEKIASD